ncbi:putative integral membrane protein [Theileria parva strain Muguga]|uniref:Uncharacterized protein n=1 Tax=Theileria parva TaxID=5875 RepID=Q4MYV1_THEPA|nr:putative integral membrane protein [Theileria parva strain Muguga]EAN30581.1 putative integral membrane protein [Theileria parva strain Muguga]|eukprot:XP_762864.1 hypothetical protein [Theileria parva strain Muguga]
MTSTQSGNTDSPSRQSRVILILAIVLAGLATLQVKRLVVTCGTYAVKRFKIDKGLTALFIKLTSIAVENFFILGIIFSAIYLIVSTSKRWDANLSIVVCWLNLIAFVIICIAYFGSGEDASLNFYYWSLNLAAFTSGMFFELVFDIVTKDLIFYLIGMPMSEAGVLIFHVAFEYLYDLFFDEQIEYFLVMNQIIAAIGLWLFAGLFWTLAFRNYDENSKRHVIHNTDILMEDGNLTVKNNRNEEKKEMSVLERLAKASSPIMLCIISCFFVYFLHPGIIPFDFVDTDEGYLIILIGVGVSAILTIVVIILVIKKIGPNQDWRKKLYAYNLLWFFPLVYTAIAVVTFYTIHYFESDFSRFVAGNVLVVGFMSAFLKSTGDFTEMVTLSAMSMQRDDGEEDGKLAAGINALLRLLIGISMFLGLGYESAISICTKNRLDWPTEGRSLIWAFFFWVGKSFQMGYHMIYNTLIPDLEYVFTIVTPEDIAQ